MPGSVPVRGVAHWAANEDEAWNTPDCQVVDPEEEELPVPELPQAGMPTTAATTSQP